METTYNIPLRVVFYYEEDKWVAHCLEFDLVGCGDSKEEALRFLAGAIETQVETSIQDDNLENLFSPAEGRYLSMWSAGKHVAFARLEIKAPRFQIEDVDYRVSNGGHAVR